MNEGKINIYFMPGLAAGPEIFDNLYLNSNRFNCHYLTWIDPLDVEESIQSYTLRLSKNIKHKNPVLIGVSFGGIITQEISKLITTQKIIIISSVKSNSELPTSFTIASKSKIYKLFPTKIITNFDDYSKFFIGKTLEKKAKLYKKYLSFRNETYLKWSLENVINWQQENLIHDIYHIHGSKDEIFPIKNIKNSIIIEGANHSMIILKAKEISKIIEGVFFSL